MDKVIRKLDGVSNVVVSLEPGQAVVHGTVDKALIQSVIVAAGFEIREDG